MKITEHFSIEEWDQPALFGQPHTLYPVTWVEERLRPQCLVLERIRSEFGGRPVVIVRGGGYRSPEYNRRGGGARNSQHMTGRASDFRVRGVSAQIVHERILALHRDGAIKIGGLGLYADFVHIDIRQGNRLARWTGSRTS